jgi:hypothetical protein
MKRSRRKRPLIVAIAVAVTAYPQDKGPVLPQNYPFRPAFVSSLSGHNELVVFPFNGRAFKIPIRSASGPFSYSADGRALYGACTPYPDNKKLAVCKVDLLTGSTTPVPGSGGTIAATGIAIASGSQRVLIAGVYPDGRPGLFEIDQAQGGPRTILEQEGRTNPRASRWNHVSLSPDGQRAVVTLNGRVELIDVLHGTAEPLEEGFFIAAWSPDGKWLAALDARGNGSTVLIDASD